MGDLFDIANLITTVGVDAVKIKPEPGLPEKSSNEILTELFSTFDGVDVSSSSSSDSDQNDNQENKKSKQKNVNIKQEKKDKDTNGIKKKKSKKKHKHKHENKDKDKEKKHKHKKKSKHHPNDSDSDADSVGTLNLIIVYALFAKKFCIIMYYFQNVEVKNLSFMTGRFT